MAISAQRCIASQADGLGLAPWVHYQRNGGNLHCTGILRQMIIVFFDMWRSKITRLERRVSRRDTCSAVVSDNDCAQTWPTKEAEEPLDKRGSTTWLKFTKFSFGEQL